MGDKSYSIICSLITNLSTVEGSIGHVCQSQYYGVAGRGLVIHHSRGSCPSLAGWDRPTEPLASSMLLLFREPAMECEKWPHSGGKICLHLKQNNSLKALVLMYVRLVFIRFLKSELRYNEWWKVLAAMVYELIYGFMYSIKATKKLSLMSSANRFNASVIVCAFIYNQNRTVDRADWSRCLYVLPVTWKYNNTFQASSLMFICLLTESFYGAVIWTDVDSHL